jgi:hypothetical protein
MNLPVVVTSLSKPTESLRFRAVQSSSCAKPQSFCDVQMGWGILILRNTGGECLGSWLGYFAQ